MITKPAFDLFHDEGDNLLWGKNSTFLILLEKGHELEGMKICCETY